MRGNLTMDAVTLTLSAPVQGPEGEIRELTLRPPTGKDLRECGAPYRVGESVDFNTDSCAKLLARLAGVLPVVVDRLAGADFNAGCLAILGFMTAPTPSAS
jgi:hypothetical protein